MGASNHVSSEASITDLLKGIVADVQGIVRAEIRLAKAEVRENGRVLKQRGIRLAASAATAMFGALFVLAAIGFALALVMPDWLAALIIGVVLLGVAGILYAGARKGIRQIIPGPEKTVQSTRENVEWAKDRMR